MIQNRQKRSAARPFLTGLVLVALFALVALQTAALVDSHPHHHSRSHCCAACHAGHLPALRAALVLLFTPACSTEPIHEAEYRASAADRPSSGPCRAPPAISL